MKMTIETNENSKQCQPVLRLAWEVVVKIAETVGSSPAETGGPVGGAHKSQAITHFHFDESSRNSAVTYSPDHELLNRLFKTDWNPTGIRFRGFVHSHPGHMSRPSCGDEIYAERILRAIRDLEGLWLPIVNTIPDTGQFRLTPWIARLDDRGIAVERGVVQIVGVPEKSDFELCGRRVLPLFREGSLLDEIAIGSCHREVQVAPVAVPRSDRQSNRHQSASRRQPVSEPKTSSSMEKTPSFDVRKTFDRVRQAYDLPRMQRSRIIAVGAGGAAEWLEQLARAGVGQFVLIDPDVVSETNLATQQTYRRDIGRAKVDCIAERLRDINPSARTVSLQKSLDAFSDKDIRRFACEPLVGHRAKKTIICGLTDDFFAQARVNRLALQLGLPSLCAQVYKEGRGAEVTFTYPGITPACHRCILSSRYHHFLERGQRNDVTSHGTPIFATTRLNAIKGFVILAMLHHGSRHPRWGKMLSRIGKRNLIQIRMDPDLAETVGLTVFNRVLRDADTTRLFFDETVWLPQDQECPQTGHKACPDCGGTGDLRCAIGKIGDTRLTPERKPVTTGL